MLTGWNVKLASINEYIALSSNSYKVPPMVWFYCLVVSQIFHKILKSTKKKNLRLTYFIKARERNAGVQPPKNISLYWIWRFPTIETFGFLGKLLWYFRGTCATTDFKADWQIDLLNGIYNCDGWEKYLRFTNKQHISCLGKSLLLVW